MPIQDLPTNDDSPMPEKPAPAGKDDLVEPTADELRVFKAIADHAFYANVIADSENNFRYVNRYFAELCGYAPEEMIGRSIALVHTPEQVAVSQGIMQSAARRGLSAPQEHWYLHRDGTQFPLLVGCVAVRIDGDDCTAMSAVDVSGVRRAEAAYQTLFTEMLDGFAHHRIICDDSGAPIDYRYLAANPAFEEMTGLNAVDLVGRTVREALPGVEQSWIDRFGRVALTGVPARFEEYAQALDKHFEVTAFSPAPGEFACIFQDVTEARRASDALRGIADDLRQTQRLAKTGSWNWDFAKDEVTWSEELFGVFGLEPAPVAPSFSEQEALITPETYKALNEAVARTVETGIPYQVELEIPRADGTTRWLWARGEPVTDAEGVQVGLWGAAQDITDRKRDESERLRLEFELARALRLESIGRLAGSVAHDFNNMLTVILGHTERILARTPAQDPLRADLEEIREAADRSSSLTRQLLAFARNQPASPTVVDLNETVAGILTMLTRLIGEDIDLIWKPGRDLASVRIDPSQVGQILTNLCINARDAIAGVGRIVIETEHARFDEGFWVLHPDCLPGDYVQLSVTDSGSGMDAETLSQIFEPFFTTKELGQGTGLGLATVYGVVNQNGGFASASSEPGVGTTFSVFLPRQEAAPDATREPAEPRADRAIGRGDATILLVEDEPAILTLATKSLEGHGYVVLPASSPGDALRLASEHAGAIDLLLTDVIMPEMNGRALADVLKATRADLKVLFMSGYTSDVITGHDTAEGDAHFIAKPFHLRDLAAKVHEILDASPSAAP